MREKNGMHRTLEGRQNLTEAHRVLNFISRPLAGLSLGRLALHQNGVEFRQKFNGTIRTSLTASYDDVRRCTTSGNVAEKFVTHTETRTHRQSRDKKTYIAW